MFGNARRALGLRHDRWRLVLGLGLVLGATRLGAQEVEGSNAEVRGTQESGLEPVAPPVDTLVAWAMARAPEIAAQRQRAAAAQARAEGNGGLSDPILELSFEDAGFPEYTVGEDEMSVLGIELHQDLPWPGKRGDRRRAAAAMAGTSAAEQRAVERRIASDVQVLCARLYAADRGREALFAAREVARLLESAAAARYGAGQAAMESSIKAQLAQSRLQERLIDLMAERRRLTAQLNAILGRASDTVIGRFIVLPEPGMPPEDWALRAVANAPAVHTASANVDAASAGLAAERSEGRPDLFVGAGYGYRGEFDPMVTFRVGTALPIWRGGRQGPRVRAAELEESSRRADLQYAESSARAEAESWVAAWEQADSQVRLYREAIVPQSRIALEAARTAYASGQADFSTVVEDFDQWLLAQQQLASREADRFVARARIDALIAAPETTPAAEESR